MLLSLGPQNWVAMCSLEKFFRMFALCMYLWSEYQKSKTLCGLLDEAVSQGPIEGFVLAAHFNDQLTGSSTNLRSLQCMAGKFSNRLGVVEPFLIDGSILGFSQLTGWTTSDQGAEHLTLFDVYDSEEWNLHGMKRGYAQLVNWTFFLQYAPRNLILLDRVCSENPKSCMSCRNDYYNSDTFLAAAETFAEKNNFTIIRKSCYNWKISYDLQTFKTLAYGPYTPEKSVLLINHFGGIHLHGDQFRIQIRNSKCNRKYVRMPSSLKISEMTSAYLQKYLPEAHTIGYISVMIRMQYVAIRMKEKEISTNILPAIRNCLKNTIQVVEDLKQKFELSDIFLATDMGKYGSNYFRTSQTSLGVSNAILETVMHNFYSELFDEDITEANLTTRIEDAMYPIYASSYAALLEQNVAAFGKCLVLVGDGEFQKNALRLHSKIGYKCAVHVSGCS